MKNIVEEIIKWENLYHNWDLYRAEKLLTDIYKNKNISELDSEIFLSILNILTNIYIKKNKWEKALKYSKILIKSEKYKTPEIFYNIMLCYYNLDNNLYKKYLFFLEKINSQNFKINEFKEKINLESEVIYDQFLVDENWKNKLIIVLILTLKCNQKCVFCNVNKWNSFVPINKIKNNLLDIIEKYKWINNKSIQISLSWWEPTMHPDFWEILDMTYKYSDILEIQTNWVFFNNDKNKKELLKRNSYMKLHFLLSFHSHIEEIYNKITHTNKQYHHAVTWIINVINCCNNNNKIEINIVINKYNIEYFWEYLRFIKNNIYSYNKKNINLELKVSILKVEKLEELHYDLIVKYSDFINIIIKNLDYIKNNWFDLLLNMRWWICDIPLCSIKSNNIFKINEWFLLSNTPITHMKMSKCKLCRLDSKCPWILKSYINKFWEDEFIPL